MAIYFALLIGVVNAFFLSEYSLPIQILSLSLYKGKIRINSSFLQDKCPYEKEIQKEFETTANFLIYRALMVARISLSIGHIIAYKEQQDTFEVNSTCSNPFVFAQGEMKYSKVYYCEIIVQDICYEYVQKPHYGAV